MRDLLRLIEERGVVLFDGAMGTMLYSRGVFINQCFDEVNLKNPELVLRIHKEYIEAGAMAIETNTFGANKYKLRRFGLEDKVYELNKRGAEIAREAAGDNIIVAGSIGPLGVRIEPWGPTALDEAKDAFKEQAVALIDGGVDAIICETFSDIMELGQAIRGVKEAEKERGKKVVLIAQMTVGEDGNSLYGTEPEIFTKRIEEWGAQIVGVNCSVGPKVMLDVVTRMMQVTKLPISVMPNAGNPVHIEGRTLYLSSPQYFGHYAKRFIQLGVKIIGGCCGTTPDHIREIAQAIKMLQAESKSKLFVVGIEQELKEVKKEPKYTPVPFESKSNLAKKLKEKKFVSSCELTPPRGWDTTKLVKAAMEVKKAGFDTINIPDSPRASARMSPLATALIIEREVGIETILHYTCRDRNLLGMQSDLLGAYALGIRNLLLVTGDPPVTGDYPKATGVFDIDSIGLTNLVRFLNHGTDIGGRSIEKPTGFLIGVGANPTAVNIEREVRRFYWKIDAGAEFAITQPIFDPEQLIRFLDMVSSFSNIPILAGIWPLQSYRNAEFLNNEVPGVSIPEWILKEMEACEGDKDKEMEKGVEIAKYIFDEIYKMVQGVQIAAPLNRWVSAVSLLSYIKEKVSKGEE